jgi:DNA replicative helicase MCM subunit Mcm2 (Cdc46/Mcm family)
MTEKKRIVYDIIRQLSIETGEVERTAICSEAEKHGINLLEVDGILGSLLRNGDVYIPRSTTIYKPVE